MPSPPLPRKSNRRLLTVAPDAKIQERQISNGLFIFVTFLWLVPDRRIKRVLIAGGLMKRKAGRINTADYVTRNLDH